MKKMKTVFSADDGPAMQGWRNRKRTFTPLIFLFTPEHDEIFSVYGKLDLGMRITSV